MKTPRRPNRFTYERKLLFSLLLFALVPALVLIAVEMRRVGETIDFWQNPGVEGSLRESVSLAESSLAAETEKAAGRLAAMRRALGYPDGKDATASGSRPNGASLGGAPSRPEPRALRAAAEASGLDLVRVESHARPGGGEALLDFRRDGLPDSVRLDARTGRIAGAAPVATDRFVLAGGDTLVFAGGLLLPDGMEASIRAVREGYSFYERLRVYERYAKTKAALHAAVVLAVSALLALVASRILSRSLGRPIGALVEGTGRVRAGDLDVRIEGGSSDELGALIDAFNRMTADLKASRERLVRAERVATWAEAARRIAHEIKNPLTPIATSLHRLCKKAETLPPEERRAIEDLLAPMQEEVANLRSLADAFSEFARLPAPKPGPVDVRDLLEKVASLYREGTETRTSVAVASGTPPASGDRELLWRAFSNLVKNAVEATGGKGTIRLEAAPRGDLVEVVVADDGPGVAPEIRDKIFAPTFTTKPGGSGLGLALVERIVLDHGGTIALDPAPGEGTSFRVSLPAWRPA